MDVRIGIIDSPRDLEIELSEDTDVDALRKEIGELLTRVDGVLWLTDRKGNHIAVAGPKVSYVAIGAAGVKDRIGFG
ncbi:MAG: DUF3107 domain-containing protein [Acidimicrobiia bacterium]|nr:DUF3107 domain-containing protein [Acidimicrobiia bacterium]